MFHVKHGLLKEGKNMKTMIIKGKTFEFCGTTTRMNTSCEDIHEAYGRPSATKIHIWQNWKRFFEDELNTFDFGVATHNSWMFTITANFEIDEKWYFAEITPSHNRVYEIA